MKPVYRVPSMVKINELEPNGFTAISTFSGCGGSSLGYRMAGFKVLYANEFIEAARHTYTANKRDYTYLDGRDIRTVTADNILGIIGLKRGELDLFDGSPPCASFSTSGKREKAWGKVKKYSDKAQRVDDLFFEYARLLEGLQPKTFVAENVSGLVKGTAKGYFLEILRALKSCGYQVEARLLNSKWLGVPQARERLIFVGVRNDLGAKPVFPKPLPYQYTVRDAFDELPDTGPSFEKYKLYQHWQNTNHLGKHKTLINLVRLRWNEPSNTICATWGAGTAAITHPDKPIYPSIEQLKRLSGFPDDFVVTGSFKQQWERVGRAVPPVMMYYIASTVRDEVLRKL